MRQWQWGILMIRAFNLSGSWVTWLQSGWVSLRLVLSNHLGAPFHVLFPDWILCFLYPLLAYFVLGGVHVLVTSFERVHKKNIFNAFILKNDFLFFPILHVARGGRPCLLGRCSPTWAILPALFCVRYFWDRASILAWVGLELRYSWFLPLSSLDYRYEPQVPSLEVIFLRQLLLKSEVGD
jgi:hypothetical protein